MVADVSTEVLRRGLIFKSCCWFYRSELRGARIWAASAAGLALLLPGSGTAAQWRVNPYVQVSEAYTDNADLRPAGQERSEFITQISPGISIHGHSGRSDMALEYSLANFIYARESDRNRSDHHLSASANTELLSDHIFLDANASISQQNSSLFGPIGVDSSSDSRNRSEVRTYALSPAIRDTIGSLMSYEARLRHDHVSADSGNLSNSDANKVSLSLKNGTSFNRIGWGIDFTKEKIDYQNSTDTESTRINLSLRYSLTPHFGFLGSTGYEDNDYLFVGEKPRGTSWSGGVFWQPSNLTSLSVSTGERFFGKTRAFDFSHRSRSLLWTARYSEDVSSTRANFLAPTSVSSASGLDTLIAASHPEFTKADRDAAVKELMANATVFTATNFFTNQFFLQKRFDGVVTFNNQKTTYILSVFMDDRDTKAVGSATNLLGSSDFSNSTNIRQTGAHFVVNWQFKPRTAFNLDLGGNNVYFRDTGQDDRIKFVNLGMSHQLQRKISGAVNFRHLKRDSNVATGKYAENAITALLNVGF